MRYLCKVFVLFSLMLLSLTVAFGLEQDTSIHDSAELVINQTIYTTIDLSMSNGASLNWITANFSFLPYSDKRQQVLHQEFYPNIVKRGEDWVTYQWKKPESGQLTYSVSQLVRTKNQYEPVTAKVAYPVLPSSYDPSIALYTQPTELIDINDEIAAKAKELAGSSTDLFEVTFTIADWVTSNIAYDLNTITAEASQKATWVLDTKTGVCDELSTLYMALLRSLGIPVRFVSGVSYTTSSLFEQPWNAHAWTEVYFPGHGWVPFDLTYQQFGYIDASHVKLKVSNDADESTTTYNWEGLNLDNVQVTLNDLVFETQILQSVGVREPEVTVTARLLKEELGFGSAGVMELKLTNLASHYVTNTVQFVSAKEISFEDEIASVPVFLKPLQTKYVYVPFTISESLDSASRYTIPISFADLQSNSGLLKLTTFAKGQVYTKSDMRVLAVQESELAKSENVLESYSLGCSPIESTVFVNESVTIQCLVEQNTGVDMMQDITICLFDDCETVQFTSSATVLFENTFDKVGEVQGLAKLIVGLEEKVGKFTTVVKDKAVLSIIDLHAPEEISYGDSLNITFLIKKDSFADAQDVKVRVGRVVPSVWDFGVVSLDQNMTVGFTTDQMVPGTNTFSVIITYFDGEVEQLLTQKVEVDLINVPFFTKLWLFFVDLFA